jgi:predicted deacylase
MGKNTSSAFQVDLAALPAGFHRRRIEEGGVGFNVFIWCGAAGRPGTKRATLLINGATHGDEYEGPTVLRQWAQAWRPRQLRGTVVMVPVLNEVAFYAGARCRPDDDGNLARAFPGRQRGTPTQRLAWLFDRQLLAQCTHYADLHSAGAANELDSWAGYMHGVSPSVDRTQKAMASCFDRFWCWAGPFLPGRTLSAAAERRIPAIYTECRGAGDVAAGDARALDGGLRRLLILLGLVPGTLPKLRQQPCRITRSSRETHLQVHHLAPFDGLFVPGVKLRDRVRRGQPIGAVLGLDGESAPVKAEESGRVVMRRVRRSVRRGDALAVIAPL